MASSLTMNAPPGPEWQRAQRGGEAAAAGSNGTNIQQDKNLLLLFFRKEDLPFFSQQKPDAGSLPEGEGQALFFEKEPK
jgi:hypothetical protein